MQQDEAVNASPVPGASPFSMDELLERMDACEREANEETASIPVLEDFIARSPDNVDSRWARGQRAIGYEVRGFRDGTPDNLEIAYREYVSLEPHAEEVGSDVLLGAARILADRGDPESSAEIERLCRLAYSIFPSPQSMCILGKKKLDMDGDLRGAIDAFEQAASAGLVFARGMQAHALWRNRQPVRAMLTTWLYRFERWRLAGALQRPYKVPKPDWTPAERAALLESQGAADRQRGDASR